MRALTPPARGRRAQYAGFTLLELAITLAIIAILAVGAAVPLIAQVTQRRISDTERILEQAKETLMGYAAATGRLPCPALPDTDGFEKFAAGGTVANGNCATIAGSTDAFHGFLPAATLGFTPIDTQGYAIDAWGTTHNRIRYAVTNQTVNGITNAFTRTNGMRDATVGQLAAATLLVVCSNGTGAVAATPTCSSAATTLTMNAPAVIWSTGANAATGGGSTDEAQNPNPGGGSLDRIFVSRTLTTVSGSEFDDIVTWLSVGNLVSRLLLAGQLP